jgi:hypothetical protein
MLAAVSAPRINRAETPAQQRGAAGQSEQRGTTAGRNGEMGRSAAEGGNRRTQVSEQQRTSVQQTLQREHDVNRVGHVDFSINVGSRVPHSVRLAELPAAIVSQVPQWRGYRYFVSNDQICIVDPSSYAIVEVIGGPSQAAGLSRGAVHAGLSLTPEERAIVMRSVALNGGSTLGLGALSEGATVPRDVQMRAFPERVQREVPKLHGYKYFSAENRVAIVNPRDDKVALVIGR